MTICVEWDAGREKHRVKEDDMQVHKENDGKAEGNGERWFFGSRDMEAPAVSHCWRLVMRR